MFGQSLNLSYKKNKKQDFSKNVSYKQKINLSEVFASDITYQCDVKTSASVSDNRRDQSLHISII